MVVARPEYQFFASPPFQSRTWFSFTNVNSTRWHASMSSMCWHISVVSLWWYWWRVTSQKGESTEKTSSFFFAHCLVSLDLCHHVVSTHRQPCEDCCNNSGLNYLRTFWSRSALCYPAASMVQHIHMVSSSFRTIQQLEHFPTYDLWDMIRWKKCVQFSAICFWGK